MAEISSTVNHGVSPTRALDAEQPAPETAAHEVVFVDTEERRRRWYYRLRTSFDEFLGLPVALAAGLVAFGALLYALERADPAWILPVRALIMRYFFQTSDATRATLDMVGSSGLTTASIIITLLLLVLQQSAGNMGNMIYDQFLQRRTNQMYVGLVIGLTVMAFFLGATVSDDFNPVIGATVVVILVILLVMLLMFLLYFTIEQMRPEEIIDRIHQRTLAARQRQIEMARRTRNTPELSEGVIVTACSKSNGFVVEINIDAIAECIHSLEDEAELVVLRKIGDYVHYGDSLAEAHARRRDDARRLAHTVGVTFRLATMREMTYDPAFGLNQLEMMAWTEISSAKHNPETGMLVIYTLRDILSRWADQNSDPEDNPLPIVYLDRLPPSVIDTLESLAVVAGDGVQHQNLIEIILTVERLYDHLPPELQQRAEEMIVRLLPNLKRFTLVHHLETALRALAQRLEQAGKTQTVQALRSALQDLQP